MTTKKKSSKKLTPKQLVELFISKRRVIYDTKNAVGFEIGNNKFYVNPYYCYGYYKAFFDKDILQQFSELSKEDIVKAFSEINFDALIKKGGTILANRLGPYTDATLANIERSESARKKAKEAEKKRKAKIVADEKKRKELEKKRIAAQATNKTKGELFFNSLTDTQKSLIKNMFKE
jgi:hypothetical protein